MSKIIRVIKCPQCQSTKHTHLGDEKYLCTHCNAEFILDNDDINIIVNRQHKGHADENAAPVSKRNGIIIGVILFVCITVLFVIPLTRKNTPVAVSLQEEGTYAAIPGTMNIISGPETEQPLCIIAEKQTDRRGEVLSIRVVVYDIKSQKLLGKIPVNSKTKLEVKAFSDTSVYLISDMRILYRLSIDSMKLTDITGLIKTTYSRFSSGISSVGFSPEAKALTVITNEGKAYTLFPDIQEVYTAAELAEMKQKQAKPDETVLYADESGLLRSYKNPEGKDYIAEYADAKTKEVKWKINSTVKVEQARPCKSGFILTGNSLELTFVQQNGEHKQVRLP